MSSALSADTKDALARDVPANDHCRAALRAGLERFGVTPGTTAFRTLRSPIARLYWSLLDEHERHPIRRIADRRLARSAVFEIDAAGHEAPGSGSSRVPRCDRRMELRAAFLGCGSLAEPAHGYHLEFVPPTPQAATRLTALLRADGHAPHQAVRKGHDVVYFKGIDAIVGVLSAIGAYAAVLHLEDVRALKETKNRIHRLVNTETANVARAASAAAVQRGIIASYASTHGFGALSPRLREIAELRLAHPTETLTDLGARCRPPISKSTVNGRLTALLRVARRAHATSLEPA